MDNNNLQIISALRQRLERGRDGSVAQTLPNCVLVFREDPLFAGAIRFNALSGRIFFARDMGWKRFGEGITDNDLNNIYLYIQNTYGIRNDRRIQQGLHIVAQENAVHPIREYLESLTWDGTLRIRHALHHFLGAPDDDLTEACLRMFMLGAIQRVFKPGCKFEYVLTLVGGQGIGKSTFFRFLAVQDKWFSDDLSGFRSPRIFEKISGHWIIEMSEMLAVLNTGSSEEAKAFLSRQADVYREPYATLPSDRPRQCVFGATTNRVKCLPFDRTGNRRFLPILVDEEQAEVHILADEKASRAYFDQLWAEAVAIYRSGSFSLKFTQEMESHLRAHCREFMAEDTLAGMIQEFLDNYDGDRVCTAQLFRDALRNPYGKPSRQDSMEVGDIMRYSITGWRPCGIQRFEEFGRQRAWERVNKVCQQSDENPERAPEAGENAVIPGISDEQKDFRGPC